VQAYFEQLFSSQLPLPLAGIMALWAAMFMAAWFASRQSRIYSASQTAVRLQRELPPRSVGAFARHVVLALVLIGIGPLMGGATYVFVTGGWVVVTAALLGISLHAMLSARALAQPGAAEGSVRLAQATVHRTQAGQLIGASAICIATGLLLPHLSLLGGGLFLGVAAIAVSWRAQQSGPPAP
jgi:hypothetical protein